MCPVRSVTYVSGRSQDEFAVHFIAKEVLRISLK